MADFAEETATEYRKHAYEFEDVDIILLEGIYLLKRSHRDHFDLTLWVDCTFETALEGALQRGQEGLSAADTVRAYETVYFPSISPRTIRAPLLIWSSRMIRGSTARPPPGGVRISPNRSAANLAG